MGFLNGHPPVPVERASELFDFAVEAAVGAVAPPAAPPVRPTPAPVVEAAADARPQRLEPGCSLSPSEANTFLNCPARWYFKYMRRLPDPSNGARVLGSAFHKALEFHWKAVLAKDPRPMAEVLEVYGQKCDELLADATLGDEESAGEVRATGAALTEVYLRDVAPSITPAAVELPVSGKVGGVPVNGFIDLVDVDGCIIDSKSAAKKPSGIRPDYRFQVSTYKVLSPKLSGRARLDTITKTATIQVVAQSFDVGPGDVKHVETMYPFVQDAIKDGLFYPRRDNNLCSRKWCPFWRACEAEFGGTVE